MKCRVNSKRHSVCPAQTSGVCVQMLQGGVGKNGPRVRIAARRGGGVAGGIGGYECCCNEW